jgi:hypothetical protein
MRGIGSSANAVDINVSAGKLTVLGLIPNADVATVGGTLSGTGQIGNLNATSGFVLPDVPNTPLRTANVVGSLASKFQFNIPQFNQTTRVSATGTVDLNGSQLVLTGPGDLPLGSSYTLILNDGGDAIQDQFFLVPEGKLLQVAGQTLRISYVGGDGNDVTATVVTGSTTDLASSTGPTALVGQTVTLTATVSAQTPATGVVRFFDGNTLLGEAVVNGNGVATLDAVFAAGAHSITASYQGDGPVLPSTSDAFALTVGLGQTSTTVVASTGPTARAGQPLTLSATVTGVTPVSGLVQFFDGNTLLGEAVLNGNGVATLPATFAEGLHAITATYSGDADAAGSTSAVLNLTANPELYAVGAGKGGSSAVTLRNTDGTIRATMSPFDASFTGGVRVATADFNGDGFPDVIVGTGPGVATQVKILDGKTGAEIFSVAPFEAAFTGGVYVAAADMNGDGFAEFAITPDEGGGPRVRLFDGKTMTPIADYFGIDDPNFRGGARAAFADLNGDGAADLLLSAGFGGGPRVAGFDGAQLAAGNTTAKLFNDFFAFEEGLRNGAFLAGGDLDGDGKAELVAGGGPGGGPRVTAFAGADLLGNTQTVLANFFAGDPNNRGGVPVGVKQLTADSAADILAGAGFTGGAKVTAYNGEALLKSNTDPLHSFDAFPGFTGGVFVG